MFNLRQIYLGLKIRAHNLLIKTKIYNPAYRGRHGLVGSVDKQEMKREFQINFLKKVGLLPDHFVCDIGCGTLRGGIPIINYLNGSRYYGLESRAFVIEEAKRELVENNLQGKNPKIVLMSNAENELRDIKFDIIWAFSVLIHMTDTILEEAFQLVASHLKSNGAFYFNVNIGKNERIGSWQGYPVNARPLHFYQTIANRVNMDVEMVDILKNLGHVSGIERQDQQYMLKASLRSC